MRLDHPRVRRVGPAIDIDYDGRRITAHAGETIAAALAAHGVAAYRHTRDGGRRGLYCGMGACFECLVTVDGRANQRACLTKVADGQRIRSQVPAGTAEDPLMPLVPLPDATGPEERTVDLLVIGAGPAGLAAAEAAARRGADVVVLDERPQSGGQYFKPLAPSHSADRPTDRQFRDGATLVEAARRAGVVLLQEVTVWGAHAPDEVVAVVGGREVVFRPKRLVLAAGAYERPAPFDGWTLPGVMTTGAAQTLARAYRVTPGRRVVVAGNGPLNLQLANELVASGVEVAAVLESAPRPSPRRWRRMLEAMRLAPDLVGAGAGYLLRLRRAGVPVLWGHVVVAARGDGRLERLSHAPLGADGVPDMARAVTVEADALCLGYGFIPSTEIARALGCAHRVVDRHLGYLATEIAVDGATSVPGVFAVGDGVDLGGSRVALARGRLSGIAAATQLGLADTDPGETDRARADLARAEAFQSALWAIYDAPPARLDLVPDETLLCRCEEITFGRIRAEIAAGHDSLGALKRNTRLGMGRCQGRYCSATASRLLAETTGRRPAPEQMLAPRLPAKPAPAGAFAFEKPEWGGHQRAITPNLARPLEVEPLPDQQADILVIGGGVVGSCLAYYLSQAGQDVMVVERDDTNLQASGANAGSLHVQLLSFDFGAKAEAGGGPAADTLVLGPRSVALWRELERACGADFEMGVTGGLMVADSEAGMAFLRAKAALERSRGIENEIIGASELRRLAPALSERLVGAEYAPQEGKINPLRATYAVLEKARRQGARFLRGVNVTGIGRQGAGWTVQTSRCRIRAGRIVNASGPWSRETGRLVGIDVPVHSAPLQMIVTEPAPPLVGQLVAHADRHLSLKQAKTGGLIIGGAWTAAFDPARRFNSVTRSSIEGNLWVANHVLPQMAGLHVVRAWAAMNINIDGAPILGPVPGLPGFFNTVTSNGYTLAPVVARMTADLMLDGQCDIDPTPFLIDRFG
ncbi:FAD-dependent oxidoreductase [Azospirillum picis]|uniref:Glycine/D-amino acid oxidase-like deaminating enzyme/ferredoxin n=1 Tax=Azospirillum picis TaxID=488438 RepID=A0ABU0MDF6_9PROT|nr:FAD-dependent oxidoreductase [Azospirillum picis]MBP2297507.1 glycine/D-amino acid oxidase-like deaminating enzyme/ferredoxin [Azospirillum picis]MDQ0531470.1 glycine/D-amino acid oxidase-like deaminating enzyme/ferredoxin [Azospirillum picis]